MSFYNRIKNGWNAFLGRDPTFRRNYSLTTSSADRLDRRYYFGGSGKSIVSVIHNRIAVDCSMIDIRHVRLNDEDHFEKIIKSPLNDVLSKSSNIDQTARAMIRDLVTSMLDDGVVALVPTETDVDPEITDSYKVYGARTGRITRWYPEEVTVELYNERTGLREEITLKKDCVVIIENPFYSIMNEPNSTLQRLISVLSDIDKLNEDNRGRKMNLIIQLPYKVKSLAQKALAKERKEEIESELVDSQYGIAYVDATEKIIQLNRSIDNNLWEQATDLTNELFSQMGLNPSIFDGSADEATMLNYYNTTIEPIISEITDEIERKWLSKTARSQGQAMRYFRNSFKLVPISQLAEIADTFTRNEILSSNEFRALLGYRPDSNPKSNQLINSNINQSKSEIQNQNKNIDE